MAEQVEAKNEAKTEATEKSAFEGAGVRINVSNKDPLAPGGVIDRSPLLTTVPRDVELQNISTAKRINIQLEGEHAQHLGKGGDPLELPLSMWDQMELEKAGAAGTDVKLAKGVTLLKPAESPTAGSPKSSSTAESVTSSSMGNGGLDDDSTTVSSGAAESSVESTAKNSSKPVERTASLKKAVEELNTSYKEKIYGQFRGTDKNKAETDLYKAVIKDSTLSTALYGAESGLYSVFKNSELSQDKLIDKIEEIAKKNKDMSVEDVIKQLKSNLEKLDRFKTDFGKKPEPEKEKEKEKQEEKEKRSTSERDSKEKEKEKEKPEKKAEKSSEAKKADKADKAEKGDKKEDKDQEKTTGTLKLANEEVDSQRFVNLKVDLESSGRAKPLLRIAIVPADSVEKFEASTNPDSLRGEMERGSFAYKTGIANHQQRIQAPREPGEYQVMVWVRKGAGEFEFLDKEPLTVKEKEKNKK